MKVECEICGVGFLGSSQDNTCKKCREESEQAAELTALRRRAAELEGTVSGVQHVLCLDTGKGVVNQCEHVRDALDELHTERRNLKAEVASKESQNAALREQVAVARKALEGLFENGASGTAWADARAALKALADTAAAGEGR